MSTVLYGTCIRLMTQSCLLVFSCTVEYFVNTIFVSVTFIPLVLNSWLRNIVMNSLQGRSNVHMAFLTDFVPVCISSKAPRPQLFYFLLQDIKQSNMETSQFLVLFKVLSLLISNVLSQEVTTWGPTSLPGYNRQQGECKTYQQ